MLAPSDEEVGYGLDEWPVPDRVALTTALSGDGIPYRWEADVVLVVPAVAEDEVDVLLDHLEAQVSDRSPTGGVAVADGGEEAHEAMVELFLAADRLWRSPQDEWMAADLGVAADAVAASLPPYGIDDQVWHTIQGLAAAAVSSVDEAAGEDAVATDAAEVARLPPQLRLTCEPALQPRVQLPYVGQEALPAEAAGGEGAGGGAHPPAGVGVVEEVLQALGDAVDVAGRRQVPGHAVDDHRDTPPTSVATAGRAAAAASMRETGVPSLRLVRATTSRSARRRPSRPGRSPSRRSGRGRPRRGRGPRPPTEGRSSPSPTTARWASGSRVMTLSRVDTSLIGTRRPTVPISGVAGPMPSRRRKAPSGPPTAR